MVNSGHGPEIGLPVRTTKDDRWMPAATQVLDEWVPPSREATPRGTRTRLTARIGGFFCPDYGAATGTVMP